MTTTRFPSLPFAFKKVPLSLFYLLLAVFPTQLGKHLWLESSLVHGLRLDYLSLTIYLTDSILISFLLTFVVVYRKKLVATFLGVPVKQKKLLCLFLIFLLAQAFWVPFPVQHTVFTLRLFLLGLFALSVGIVPWEKRVVFFVFCIQLLGIAALTILQMYHQKSLGGWLYWLGERRFSILTPGIALETIADRMLLRPYATFSHPNVLAGYVTIILFHLYTLAPKVKNLLFYTAIFAGVFTVTISFSQGSWLAVGITLCVLFLKRVKTSSLKMVVTLSLLVPFLSFALPLEMGESIGVRNLLFKTYLHLSLSRLLLGLGWFGHFSNLGVERLVLLGKYWLQPPHHSWWLLIFALGIIPTTLLVLSLGRVVFKKISLIPIARLAPLVAIVILGTVDHYFITQPQTLYLLFFTLGYVFATREKNYCEL